MELIAKNVFELNDYLIKLKRDKFSTSPRHLINKLSRSKFIDAVFTNEVKKRKFIANKKKEVQLAGLLAVRKKSSRLEARQQRERLQQLQRQLQQQQQQQLHLGNQSRTVGGRRLRDVSGGGIPTSDDPKLDSQRRFERRQQRHMRGW